MPIYRRFPALTFAVSVAFLAFASGLSATRARASAPSVPAYGEITRFGGVDAGAKFDPTTTSGLANETKVEGDASFVDPVGMAVDSADKTAPNEYAIYVLDNVNPQALNGLSTQEFSTLKMEYRIQKLNEHGEILAATRFTLNSTAQEPGLRAVSLAVDGADGRVYALISDVPPTPDNASGGYAADRVDAWTTETLAAAPGTDDTAISGGKAELLVAPATLQPGGDTSLTGDVDGKDIVIDKTGIAVDLALGGNEYGAGGETQPVIDLLSTADGAMLGGSWKGTSDVSGTEDAAAKATHQGSEELFELGGNPDGSLNVMLGRKGAFVENISPDEEPNMATVSADLASTEGVLPSSSTIAEPIRPGEFEVNQDRAATVQLSQEPRQGKLRGGSTHNAGTLAPSVVRLSGIDYEGLYAGLVVQESGIDSQNPLKTPFTWTLGTDVEEPGGVIKAATPSNLALRVFDAQGDSVAMIANESSSGPCNLQGGPMGEYGGRPDSFIALAAGRNGTVFVLVQSDLDGTKLNEEEESPIAPGSAIGAGTGDQVVELVPGAGQNGAAGQECPQPSGGFSITNETLHSEADKGNGPITVFAGAKLELDAEEVDLQDGAPWAYNWDSGAKEGGVEMVADHPWTVNNKFASNPTSTTAWEWPTPIAEFTYDTPGSYRAKLSLVNDFGTLSKEREVHVVKDEPITGVGIAAPSTVTVGQSVLFEGSAVLPEFDSARAYHWAFGDEVGESVPTAQVEHAYAAPGVYPVVLRVEDALGQKAEATKLVTVVAGSSGEVTPTPIVTPPAVTPPATLVTSPVPPSPPVKVSTVVKPRALTKAQQLANALKACRKQPKKKRASCEKQTKKKYNPPKKKGKKGRR